MGPGIGYLLPVSGNMLYFYQDEAELVEVVADRLMAAGLAGPVHLMALEAAE